MNQNLIETVQKFLPDTAIFCLFKDEFSVDTIKKLRNYTKTVAYFFDDPWRRKYVEYWTKYFDFFTTSDYYMYKTYTRNPKSKVIYSPFGFNSAVFSKKDFPKKKNGLF